MPLISLRNAELAFGAQPVLDGVTLHVDEGDRIGLLGRNGAGKSSLLAVLAGALTLDSGSCERLQGLRVGLLEQTVPTHGGHTTVREVIAADPSNHVGDQRATVGERHADRQVDEVLSRLSLDPIARFGELSAGNRRRVLFGRAVCGDPQLLLLDEPTNHLDIDAIEWLERFLLRRVDNLVFITHDRALLSRLATRVVELDRGKLYEFSGSYTRFVAYKQQALAAAERADARLDKKLAAEEGWLRGGLKARRIRNMGRVRALERLRELRRARRERVGVARVQVHEAQRSGKLVSEVHGVTAGYDGQVVIRDLSTIVLRGDKVGIVGPNGCGKTTLLNTLLGKIEPAAGRLRLGARLQIAYFDQLREQLDDDLSVADNVADRAERVQVGGGSRHVIGYLEDWLFSAERAKTPVGVLSGGERNRLLLARLFLAPSNLLVLDEPTNDLDIETLELLEQRLIEYSGTLLVVSHDRSFLDNVVTSTLVYEGAGHFVEHAGGYSDWQVAPHAPAASSGAAGEAARGSSTRSRSAKPKTPAAPKLSFKERRELDALPVHIEQLEAEQQAVRAQLSDPGFYRSGGEAIATAKRRLLELESAIEQAYQRWQALEEITDRPAIH